MPRYLNIALLLALILVPCTFAAQGSDGIDFAISRSTTGFWEKSRHHLANDWVSHLPDKNKKLEYIAITYTLTNNNENRKLDLSEGFDFFLQDELGNKYRRIKKPAGYSAPVILVAKNFPSLYPGESYGETLFFEAPLAKASRISLIIKAESIGIKDQITLAVDKNSAPVLPPPNKNLLSGQTQKAEQTIIAPPRIKTSDLPAVIMPKRSCPLKITTPENGVSLEAGRPVRIKVSVEPEQIPDRILITGPGFSAGDPSPKVKNIYDFMVPLEQSAGIHVITVSEEWSDTSSRLPSCSDNIFVYINNPSSTAPAQKQ